MKKSTCLLVSFILGICYIIFLAYIFGSAVLDPNNDFTAGLATMVVFPHFICAGLATLFTALSWSMNKKGFALTGAILFVVSMILFPMYFMFVIIQTILSFVGYAKIETK